MTIWDSLGREGGEPSFLKSQETNEPAFLSLAAHFVTPWGHW
jgi:hypothetical protein